MIAIASLWPLAEPDGAAAAVAPDTAPNYRVVERDTAPPAIPVVLRATLASTSSDPVVWSDVDSSYGWARQAIGYVGASNAWMRDYPAGDDGTYPFRPGKIETRKYFARALVRAFAPLEDTGPGIVFTDLDPTSPFYPFANVAVKLGWMTRSTDGAFMPDSAVTLVTVHRALVLRLGLASAAHALNDIHTRNGVGFDTPPGFGTTVLGYRLGLRYNNGDESKDLVPWQPMPRAQVAYSLFHAATQPSWTVPAMLRQYADVELPRLGAARKLVQWGIRYAGYPYVWGGEWGKDKPEPAALGGQPIPGFDCSGLTWWLIRSNDSYSWHVAPPRPYAGWALPQRTSADMARNTVHRIRFADLIPGDVMFYDGNDDGVVDHVDTYIGNGFSLDSSSTPGGVTIMWVGDGWYRDHFVFGRRVLPR